MLLTMAFVDVVLGPLVTLIVFDRAKSSLRKDIITIVMLQLAFLTYGVYSLYAARPVHIVFEENRFVVTSANDIDNDDLAKAGNARYRTLVLVGFDYVGTIAPEDQKLRNDLVFASLAGIGLHNLPQHYTDYEKVAKAALAASRSDNDIPESDFMKPLVLKFAKQNGSRHIRFVRLITREKPRYVAIDGVSGLPIALL